MATEAARATAKLLVARLLGEELTLVHVKGEAGVWVLKHQSPANEGLVVSLSEDNYQARAVNLEDVEPMVGSDFILSDGAAEHVAERIYELAQKEHGDWWQAFDDQLELNPDNRAEYVFDRLCLEYNVVPGSQVADHLYEMIMAGLT
jgi:hypothetical protein